MRFGKIAAAMLAIGTLTIVVLDHLTLGWSSPVRALGGLLIMVSFGLAWGSAMLGIVRDRPRWLSVLTGVISGCSFLVMLLYGPP